MKRLLIAFGLLTCFWACESDDCNSPSDPYCGAVDCDTCSVSVLSRHAGPIKVMHDAATISNLTFPSSGWIAHFLGDRSYKLVFVHESKLYLLLPNGDGTKAPLLYRIDDGDESSLGSAGKPTSPMLSPNGEYLVYQGTGNARKMYSFMTKASVNDSVWRTPVVPPPGGGRKVADPRFIQMGDSLYIYYVNNPGTAGLVSSDSLGGYTYKVQVVNDTLGKAERATLRGKTFPGAFKGGISRDLQWSGTTYSQTALFNAENDALITLNGTEQMCNPSINPFISGPHTDYLMVLGFGTGGAKTIPALGGNQAEGLHEHLWVWNKDNKAVWGASLPGVMSTDNDRYRDKKDQRALYNEWQRNEWSTDGDYAVSMAKRRGTASGQGYDLFILAMNQSGKDLKNNPETEFMERGGVFQVTGGNMTVSSDPHLWIGESCLGTSVCDTTGEKFPSTTAVIDTQTNTGCSLNCAGTPISSGEIMITSPSCGTIAKGSKLSVTWTEDGLRSGILISLGVLGQEPEIIVKSGQINPNTLKFDYQLPADYTCCNCVLTVYDYLDASVSSILPVNVQ